MEIAVLTKEQREYYHKSRKEYGRQLALCEDLKDRISAITQMVPHFSGVLAARLAAEQQKMDEYVEKHTWMWAEYSLIINNK